MLILLSSLHNDMYAGIDNTKSAKKGKKKIQFYSDMQA